MRIRNSVSIGIFFVVAICLIMTGWYARHSMQRYQEGIARHFHAELLEQGSSDFGAAAAQFFQVVDTLAPSASAESLLTQLRPHLVSDTNFHYLFFRTDGEALEESGDHEAIQALVSSAMVTAFYEEARDGAAREMIVDNYQSYLDGESSVPAIVQLRAFPAHEIVLGMGRTQELAGIRLHSLSDISSSLIAQATQRGMGFFLLLMVATLFLTWLALQFVLLRPLVRIFAQTGTGSMETGLSWSELREYAGRLRKEMDEKEVLRGKLEQEIEKRFKAEEERDRAQTTMDHALHKYEEKISQQYAAHLLKAQAELMQREARALHRHLAAPLEEAHKLAASNGLDESIHAAIDHCLSTVHGLVDQEQDLPHTPAVTALRPWLESILGAFEQANGRQLHTNIQNGANVHIDGPTMARAFASILENALQASDATSRIDVDTALQGDTVEIRIVDRGTGIDGESRPHILVPFFSLKEGQDGLGLSIARSIIRQHGGSLRFQSEAEKGTAVIIVLPLASS